MDGRSEKVSVIWSVADLLRGDYKVPDCGNVILPFYLSPSSDAWTACWNRP